MAKLSLRQKARPIVREIYLGETATPRKDACMALRKRLKMEKTTAATYVSEAIQHFREAEQTAALAKAEQGKPVWSVYKTKQNLVTSVGYFLTKKSATAFNTEFRHEGVVKGIQPVKAKLIAAVKKAA